MAVSRSGQGWTIGNPELRPGDSRQVRFELLSTCELTVVVSGPVGSEELFSAVLQAAPFLGESVSDGGGFFRLTRDSATYWTALSGDAGSALLVFCLQGSDSRFVFEHLVRPLDTLTSPLQRDLVSKGVATETVANIIETGNAFDVSRLEGLRHLASDRGGQVLPARIRLQVSEWRRLGTDFFQRPGNFGQDENISVYLALQAGRPTLVAADARLLPSLLGTSPKDDQDPALLLSSRQAVTSVVEPGSDLYVDAQRLSEQFSARAIPTRPPGVVGQQSETPKELASMEPRPEPEATPLTASVAEPLSEEPTVVAASLLAEPEDSSREAPERSLPPIASSGAPIKRMFTGKWAMALGGVLVAGLIAAIVIVQSSYGRADPAAFQGANPQATVIPTSTPYTAPAVQSNLPTSSATATEASAAALRPVDQAYCRAEGNLVWLAGSRTFRGAFCRVNGQLKYLGLSLDLGGTAVLDATQDSSGFTALHPDATYRYTATTITITTATQTFKQDTTTWLAPTDPSLMRPGDLGLSTPISYPACDDSAIVVYGKTWDPSTNASKIQSLLNATPGSSYLRTDLSCGSFTGPSSANSDQQYIYAVYTNFGKNVAEACTEAKNSGGVAHWISNTRSPADNIIKCS